MGKPKRRKGETKRQAKIRTGRSTKASGPPGRGLARPARARPIESGADGHDATGEKDLS